MTDSDNPYATPSAELTPAADPTTGLAVLPRLSTTWVLVLTIVTLGLYLHYWLFSRSNLWNRHFASLRIPPSLIVADVGLVLVRLYVSVGAGLLPGAAQIVFSAGYQATFWVSLSLMIAWSLVFRARLAQWVSAVDVGTAMHGGSAGRKPSIALAIVPGPVYLAWWINRELDEDRDRRQAA